MSIVTLYWIIISIQLVLIAAGIVSVCSIFNIFSLPHKHKWKTINQGSYRDEHSNGWKVGNYYDQECTHCGKIRQVKM